MSSTRHASENSYYRQERFMSSPEYVECRGLNGNLVSARCELLLSARKRSLIYFLQALSHREGGLRKVAHELIAMFPERLGTPVMHQLGIKADKIYPRDVMEKVDHDLIRELMIISREDDEDDDVSIFRKYDPVEALSKAKRNVNKKPIKGSYLIQVCRRLAIEKMPEFLADFCLNPKLRFALKSENVMTQEFENVFFPDHNNEHSVKDADLVYFHDIVGAIVEYQRRYEEKIKQTTIVTEIGRKVYDTLDYALKSKRMVIIEGNARLGKTVAAKNWCEINLGHARYVAVPSSNAERDLFIAIAEALGLPTSQRKNIELHDLINKALKPKHIMLVLDEAHFLWPQKNIRIANPVRLNWVRTELIDKGIAVVLITTPQAWKNDRTRTIKNTGWAFEQFEGRVTHSERLPTELSVEDLKNVAKFMFPSLDNASLKFLAGMAMTRREYLGALDAVAHRARWYWAEKAGRTTVTFKDIDNAVKERLAVATPKEQSQDEQRKPRDRSNMKALGNKFAELPQSRFRPRETGLQMPVSRSPADRLGNQKTVREVKEDHTLIPA